MLFDIEEDLGDRISGWVVPDHPSAQPVVQVFVSGRPAARVAAGGLRPELRARGLHTTGLCGFRVDRTTCPGLAPGLPVELFEERSNLLIYRRRPIATLPARLFLLETQITPPYPLFQELSPLVQMSYGSVETVGAESLGAVLGIRFSDSLLVSGAVLYRRFREVLFTAGFARLVLLGDPYRELAARLLRLKDLAAGAVGWPDWRNLGQDDLVAAVHEVDLTDAPATDRLLRRLDDAEAAALGNPLVRRLGATDLGEPLDLQHVGAALDSLADFEFVGFHDTLDPFLRRLEGALAIPALPRRRPVDPYEGAALAAALRRSRPATALLALDVELLRAARQAIASVSADGRPGLRS